MYTHRYVYIYIHIMTISILGFRVQGYVRDYVPFFPKLVVHSPSGSGEGARVGGQHLAKLSWIPLLAAQP